MKENVVSFAQTFVSSFLTILGTAVLSISPSQLTSPEMWKVSAIGGVILACVRSALKVAWQKTLPESIGGQPKN